MTTGDCKPKAALWARVSTGKEEQAAALEHQLERLREEAERRGYEVVRVYQHRGLSAYNTQSGLDRSLDYLIAHSESDGFSVLLVTRVDRLSRGGVLHTLAAVQRLADNGVRLEALDDIIFSAEAEESPEAQMLRELLLANLAAVARLQSAQQSQRVRRGQARARREGKHLGRPRGARDKRPRKSAG